MQKYVKNDTALAKIINVGAGARLKYTASADALDSRRGVLPVGDVIFMASLPEDFGLRWLSFLGRRMELMTSAVAALAAIR
jgi:hypothetical protein